jgi:hypothetical protein
MLQQRALLAERFAAEAAAEEELELEQLCHAVTCSLELDRYDFLRVVGPAAPVPHPRARTQTQLETSQRDSALPLGIAR